MKKLSGILYLAAVILFILFVVLLVISYISYKKLLLNPLVMVAPFSNSAKRLSLHYMLPSVLCGILGYSLNRKSKRR